ncbi:hypothetical protein NDN08_005257 [Rhodosorus marinus]|uniref:Serine aminopeptidase S33 domain-containing protein n=1 Tax=Rhodosorus marinus TaxID=101924 RepID=A0AAV8V403_9RHOD|nr:hypothetical protein NDN08_005257 [Rhodosorus marinus]
MESGDILSGDAEADKLLLEKVNAECSVNWGVFGCDAFEGWDGGARFWRSWRPSEDEELKGAVIVVHGLHGHSGRYEHVAKLLVSHGYSTFSFDGQGHGRSSGARGHLKSLDGLLTDLKKFHSIIAVQETGKPVYALGHSMGGMIAIVASLTVELDGIFASAPSLKVGASPIQATVIKVLSAIAPKLVVKSLKGNLEGDTDPFIKLVLHPDLVLILPCLPNEILKGVKSLQAKKAQLKVPLAIAHSLHDEVCDPTGSKAFIESLDLPGKKLYLYDDIKVHELLSPQTYERVLSDMLDFINSLS